MRDVSGPSSEVFHHRWRSQSVHRRLRRGRCAHLNRRRRRGFVTLATLGVPYALLFGWWVALVDFLPAIGGALAGIPTVLFALGHSLTAGIVTLVVFLLYAFFENHILNPIVMSRTVKVNPLLVFIAVLIGSDIGSWSAASSGVSSAPPGDPGCGVDSGRHP